MIKQTGSQALGRSGERWFANLIPREWLFHKPEEDIGIDGKVTLGTHDTTGDLEFAVQIKTKKCWDIKSGIITLGGISRDTVKYWGSRLYPTMIVLYDESSNCGYFGWLFDIMCSPHELFDSPYRTISFQIPASSRLDSNSWEGIRQSVESYYVKFVESLTKLRGSINTLPTIHTISQSLLLLLTAQFERTENKEQKMMIGLGQVVAHREIFRALSALNRKYGLSDDTPHAIKVFIDAYRRVIDSFISDFDAVLSNLDDAIVVQTNHEIMENTRPRLICMLSQLLTDLSDAKHSPNPRGVI